MGLSGDMNYGLFSAARQQARPQQNAPQQGSNDLDAIQEWLKQGPRPTEEKPQGPIPQQNKPIPRFELLSEAKQQAPKQRPMFDPSTVPAEEIAAAGGIKEYVKKATGVELFRGNYDNATALVSYLAAQEPQKDEAPKPLERRGFQASRGSVMERLNNGDYQGALSDIDKMKAMNDMFARAISTVQKEIQNNVESSFKYFQ